MSYDLHYNTPDLEAPMSLVGGIYTMGGSTVPELNITWNYAEFFYQLFGDGGIRSLSGLTSAEVVDKLIPAIRSLGGPVDDSQDYWKATKGNAAKALSELLKLSLSVPVDAKLEVQ